MTFAAHWETAEGRADSRRTLRLEAEGMTADGARADVLVHNLSEGGLLIETVVPLAVGEELAIVLPHAGPTTARVRWSSGRLHGCAFAGPISSATLSAAQLRSVSPVIIEPSALGAGPDTGFAARLQRLRKARGLTLAQIAARLGVSKPTVWAWEQGRSRPVEGRIAPLLEALGVTRAELLPEPGDHAERDGRIAHWREQIALAAGADPARVRIMIEL